MRRLSQTRRRILAHLAKCNSERDGCPDAREIAQACGEHHRASDWAHGPLREMAFHGLVERVGVSPSNASTWRITDAGRTALDRETEETGR
jgi:hypothetical protein